MCTSPIFKFVILYTAFRKVLIRIGASLQVASFIKKISSAF